MMNKKKMPVQDEMRVSKERLRRATQLPPIESRTSAYDGFLGQSRAWEAASLAASMEMEGFNLFVAAPRSTPVRPALKKLLREQADTRPTPSDWVYVYNFSQPHAPRAFKLPPGKASFFRTCMREMILDLRVAIPAAFDKPDVQTQRMALKETFKERQEDAFEELGKQARSEGVAILRIPTGFSLVPMRDDKVLKAEEINKLSDAEKEQIDKNIEKMEKKLEAVMQNISKWERDLRDGLRKLERETIETAITHSIDQAKKELRALTAACEHLDNVRQDLIENVALFLQMNDMEHLPPISALDDDISLGPLDRYDVNVFVEQSGSDLGAPVIEESHPTLAHLIGRVEHRAEDGVLSTSFKLIKPGALHLANGGYLILDARHLLSEPMSWQALKRSLQNGCVKTESLAEALSLTSTITLDPAPIPLSIKIVLVGDALIYHLLVAHDPEFANYFKLLADFSRDMPRTAETEAAYASSLIGLAKEKAMLVPSQEALIALVEEAARETGDAQRLSLATDSLLDLMSEASHYAAQSKRTHIIGKDIEATIRARDNRMERIRDYMHEQMLRDISLILTKGEVIGQINGLSVYQFGGYAFGKPSRITARTRPGRGRVIDIEREANLGGPIHSKGVLILTGYLSGKYVLKRPLSVLISIVLEQSYGGVEGDSASLAELIAILSSLSNIPIQQSLAMTGAVNQLGEVQAIGGVNQKIEGFYKLCADRGLTGDQGVIIPASNVQHLMLRHDVVKACEAGQFHIYAVSSVDEALCIMMRHPSKDVHERVEARLIEFAEVLGKASAMGDAIMAEKVNSEIPEALPPQDPPYQPPDRESKSCPIKAPK